MAALRILALCRILTLCLLSGSLISQPLLVRAGCCCTETRARTTATGDGDRAAQTCPACRSAEPDSRLPASLTTLRTCDCTQQFGTPAMATVSKSAASKVTFAAVGPRLEVPGRASAAQVSAPLHCLPIQGPPARILHCRWLI